MQRIKQPAGLFTLCLLIALLLTLMIYGRTLGYPLYSDDLVQIPWLRTLSFGEIWTTLSPYDYYRPLVFTIWWLAGTASGEVPIVGLRLLNMSLHAVAAALLGTLLYQLDKQKRLEVGIIGTLLFVTYPFAYQIVPWISGMFYPLVVSLMLLSTLAYLNYQHNQRMVWLIAAVIAALLAPLAHENGMLTLGLIVGLEALFWWRERNLHLLRLLPFALLIGYMFFWLGQRQGAESTVSLEVVSLLGNAEILSTGLSYPFGPINALFGVNALTWLFLLLALLVIGLLARQQIGLLGVGLLWFTLNALPVLLVMRPEWLLAAPRFLYPAGVGAVMLWALAAANLSADGIHWREALSLTLVSVIMVPATISTRQTLEWYTLGLSTLEQVSETELESLGEQVHYINLPNVVEPKQQTLYPYFSGGVELLPSRVDAENLTGEEAALEASAIQAGMLLLEQPYRYLPYGEPIDDIASLEGRIYITRYAEDDITVDYVGRTVERSFEDPIVTFGQDIRLMAHRVSMDDGNFTIRLHWEVMGRATPAETVFVHAVNDANEVVGQADGSPWGGLLPLYLADSIEDVRTINGLQPGRYRIFVGVWQPDTGERLPTSDQDPDRQYLLTTMSFE